MYSKVLKILAHTTGMGEQEAAETAIDEIRIEFGVDAFYESINENLNPEVHRLVNSFINKMADRYDISLQDVVYNIMTVLRSQNYDGLNERKKAIKEANSNYPDFDLDKNIKYQDTSISSGMWRYTGKEQGGKGVYRNLNNGQILGFDRSDFDIFRKTLVAILIFSESVNEDIYDKFLDNTQNPKGRAKIN
eukprot:TRINITY_DN9225_c0_g1_i1.p1 TRINITY_DN9225_c0_g1~~TRINITY_DN9225_c0_g1_i1.p1  ORF type:complete len:191 (-),score=35.02 TRINITY_DN9225_c0_g1_i1:32-604(-)